MIAGDYGMVLRTTNGGATWALQRVEPARRLNAISFTDAKTVTVVGDSTSILRTAN